MEGFAHPEGFNCTQPAIDDFPPDLFTPAQRAGGAVIIHALVSFYMFVALAVVCEKYFVPAVVKICKALNMKKDVAGATFMAAATSAPELFINVIGTFITEGDIGIGTVVGSAVFNILAVAACCGIVTKKVVPLDWWPLTRDCLAYGVTVSILIAVIHDERVEWYEALILVVLYIAYIAVMYFDKFLHKCAREVINLASRPSAKSTRSQSPNDQEAIEVRLHLRPDSHSPETEHQQHNGDLKMRNVPQKDEIKQVNENDDTASIGTAPSVTAAHGGSSLTIQMGEQCKEDNKAVSIEIGEMKDRASVLSAEEDIPQLTIDPTDDGDSPWKWPKEKGWVQKFYWVITWPISVVFILTIPDCEKPYFRKWFPMTFLMCIVWIGSLSYVIAWMITVIGDTLHIPDSVMGITLLAAGTSVPEAVSSVIVAGQGHGTMGISNSIGSNTFDILLCLGLPWLIKASFLPTKPGQYWVAINSAGLEYSAISLLSTLMMLYAAFWWNNFKLDARVGKACLFMYIVFLVLASLIELNVFFPVNLPTCGR